MYMYNSSNIHIYIIIHIRNLGISIVVYGIVVVILCSFFGYGLTIRVPMRVWSAECGGWRVEGRRTTLAQNIF